MTREIRHNAQTPKKKMSPEEKRRMINISLVVFFVSIVVFAVVGAVVVDSFSNLQQIEDLSAMEEDTYKGEIDDRLRFIALQNGNKELADEDNGMQELKETQQSDEPEEIAAFLQNEGVEKNKFEIYNEQHKKKTSENSNANDDKQIYDPNDSDIPYRKDVPYSTTPSLKVVVGSFSTREAAEEQLAKISSQFTAPPFVKAEGSKFTLQVGSFKTPQTAKEFANTLKQQGYNARIIEE